MAAQPLTAEEELYWIALLLVPGLGPRLTGRLLEFYQTPRRVFEAREDDLQSLGIRGSIAGSIASGVTFEDAVLQQEKLREVGGKVLTAQNPAYPKLLRDILDPPALLFARGRLDALEHPAVALVGTRRPTPYGAAVAEKLGGDLAAAGIAVVSGMARGIDTAAHLGALATGGTTIAVFGCGVDVTYPKENARLAARIVEHGLLLSEFPMGAPAFPQNFPIRNRIVAGLGYGVCVVEGAEYSGSSITAKLALESGRRVYAVPGNITSSMSWGPNLLIKQGAHLVRDWQDITGELPLEIRRHLRPTARTASAHAPLEERRSSPADALGPNAPVAERILEKLKVDSTTHIDELLERVERCSSSELMAGLFELELLGLVKQLPGKLFLKIWQQ